MKIPPDFTINPEMLVLLTKIEASRMFFSSLKIPLPLKEKIQRVSLLKSSLFSARIEGNPLTFTDLESEKTEDVKKREIFNIVSAIRFIDKKMRRNSITKDTLSQLHALVLKNITFNAGYFRKEVSAIFNQAGVAVYMPPPPAQISGLLNDLLAYIHSEKEKFPLIVAFISHLVFEKIHPFLDGNGRVGRLLISAILKSKGWDFTFTIPFEEYLDEHKDEYYFYLDKGAKKTNQYLLFMLGTFLAQINRIKKQIEQELSKTEKIFLPSRQEEIFHIIKDHSIVSFDIIRRRFLKVPPRTLRYDLKKLVDGKFIEKGGETKGSYYRVKKG
ncbi:MAG: Fic family protein [Patescibacteria group bacterium]